MKEIEQLYRQYKQDVYQYLLSLTHDPDLSEDLLSDTFVNAISSLHTFKGNSSIKTWLFSIARNLWFSYLRKKKHDLQYDDLLLNYICENVVEEVISRATLQKVINLLEQKDERTRKIVEMRIKGYSFAEIAENVGILENSARVIDFRTKKWLKQQLIKEGFR